MKKIFYSLFVVLSSVCLASPALSDEKVKPPKQPTLLAGAADIFTSISTQAAGSPIHGIIDRLPRIYVVKPQKVGNIDIRGTVVAKVNCPITVATGITPPPIEFAIASLENLAVAINQKQVLDYDLQFVCG